MKSGQGRSKAFGWGPHHAIIATILVVENPFSPLKLISGKHSEMFGTVILAHSSHQTFQFEIVSEQNEVSAMKLITNLLT